MEPIVKYAELANGLRLSYAEQGTNQGTPIILLHGIADSWRIFEPLLAELPESVHVYALSQRGHGDSDRPATGYRTRDFVEDLLLFMDALQIQKAIIIGASSGGFVARSFSATHPQRSAGLILLGLPASLAARPKLVCGYEGSNRTRIREKLCGERSLPGGTCGSLGQHDSRKPEGARARMGGNQ